MSATSLFNAYVASSAISAATHIGLLDALARDLKVDVGEFSTDRELDPAVIRSVADILVRHEVFAALDDDVIVKGPEFDDVWRNQGYFLWLVRGYGEMLGQVGELAELPRRPEAISIRDGAAIARGGKDYGSRYVDHIVGDLIATLDFSVMADLGCGSANRIIQLARTYPTKRFIGVEVNSGAVEVARAAVRDAGLQDRIEIVQDDISDLRENPSYADVDAVISFFLGHDLWPEQNCLRTLETIRARLPRVRNFLLSDTYRSDGVTAPIFTLGFELTHAVMGQEIPTAQQWEHLFDKSVWRLHQRQALEIAFSDIFHLVPRSA